jgi:four helix bundle protein
VREEERRIGEWENRGIGEWGNGKPSHHQLHIWEGIAMAERIKSYKELRVYQNAFEVAMDIFHIAVKFPSEEKYSLVDQIRRSSRSVCANTAEAWRKRRYKAAFVAKLSDAESEACETQVHVQFALACGYIDQATATNLESRYEQILSQLVLMIDNPEKWLIRPKSEQRR